jgi:hypothetical protein
VREGNRDVTSANCSRKNSFVGGYRIVVLSSPHFENTKLAKLRVDGIYVEWIEKAAILYDWSSGRYHKLQVSD